MPAPRLAVAMLATLLGAFAQADEFVIDWYTVDGGGAMSTGGGAFELSGTIGQPDASGVAMTGGEYSLVGGFWPIAYACPGDCNCDGRINFMDINPFVAVLSGGPPCWFANLDMNGDGAINFQDINPFVAILSGGGGACP